VNSERTVHRDRVVAPGHKLGNAREPFNKHGRLDVAGRRSAAPALAFAVIAPAPELPALILEERVEKATAEHTSHIYKPRPECGWIAWTAHCDSDGGARDGSIENTEAACGAVRRRHVRRGSRQCACKPHELGQPLDHRRREHDRRACMPRRTTTELKLRVVAPHIHRPRCCGIKVATSQSNKAQDSRFTPCVNNGLHSAAVGSQRRSQLSRVSGARGASGWRATLCSKQAE